MMLVIDTRPVAIKLALPVREAQGITPAIVLTRQHSSLDPAAFELAAFPLHRLRCLANGDPKLHPKAVASALAPMLQRCAT